MSRKNSLIPTPQPATRDMRATRQARLLTFGLLLASVGGWSSAACATETLEQAWQTAMARDHVLAAMRADSEAAMQEAQATTALRLPTVQAQAAGMRMDKPPQTTVSLPAFGLSLPIAADRNVTLNGVVASMPLFTSGRISNAIKAARAGTALAKSREISADRDLHLQVAQRYFDVLRAQHAVKVMAAAQASLQAHAHDVGSLHAKGYVPRKDLLAVRVMLADVGQQLRESQTRLDLARAAFNRQLGRPLDAPVNLQDRGPTKHLPMDIITLTDQAMTYREEPMALADLAQVNDHLAASKRAENLPSVALAGGYARWHGAQLGTAGSWVVGVSVNWQLFDGGRTRAEASHYVALALAAREREAEARSLIRLDVRRAWLEQADARDRMNVAQEALGSASENLRVARLRYRDGLGTNADVLGAERENTASETRYDVARYDAAYAEIDLERATGNLQGTIQ